MVAAVSASHPDGVDALLDFVHPAGAEFDALAALVKPGGRIASALQAADVDAFAARKIRAANVSGGQSSPTALQSLAELAASGGLQVPIQHVYSLEQAAEALDAFRSQHTRGKLAISVSANGANPGL